MGVFKHLQLIAGNSYRPTTFDVDMPGEVEVDKEEGKADESTAPPEVTAPAPPRPVVGIIYPPPEVRSILSLSLALS